MLNKKYYSYHLMCSIFATFDYLQPEMKLIGLPLLYTNTIFSHIFF